MDLFRRHRVDGEADTKLGRKIATSSSSAFGFNGRRAIPTLPTVPAATFLLIRDPVTKRSGRVLPFPDRLDTHPQINSRRVWYQSAGRCIRLQYPYCWVPEVPILGLSRFDGRRRSLSLVQNLTPLSSGNLVSVGGGEVIALLGQQSPSRFVKHWERRHKCRSNCSLVSPDGIVPCISRRCLFPCWFPLEADPYIDHLAVADP